MNNNKSTNWKEGSTLPESDLYRSTEQAGGHITFGVSEIKCGRKILSTSLRN